MPKDLRISIHAPRGVVVISNDQTFLRIHRVLTGIFASEILNALHWKGLLPPMALTIIRCHLAFIGNKDEDEEVVIELRRSSSRTSSFVLYLRSLPLYRTHSIQPCILRVLLAFTFALPFVTPAIPLLLRPLIVLTHIA
jgi:hypothetical protein